MWKTYPFACALHPRAHPGRLGRHGSRRLARSTHPVPAGFVEVFGVAGHPLARGAVHEGFSQKPREFLGHLPRLGEAHGLNNGDGLWDPLAGELNGPGCGGVAVAA